MLDLVKGPVKWIVAAGFLVVLAILLLKIFNIERNGSDQLRKLPEQLQPGGTAH
jgi:predicted permease